MGMEQRKGEAQKEDKTQSLFGEGWLTSCRLCPRNCRAARGDGERGLCRCDARIRVARASLHLWEEPCISGEKGSGTVFFSGCSLGCVYCQNQQISRGTVGRTLTVEELARLYLILQEQGAENINLVTPTHYAAAIGESVELSRKQGLALSIVYNCSGYEKVETLRMLEGIVDIYLTDFKYMDEVRALRYSLAPDYPGIAQAALEEMVRQQGELVFDQRGMMKRGVILRHLLLPGCVENGRQVVREAFSRYGNRICYSLMNQFTPMASPEKYPEISRRVTKREYEALVDYALELGVENGFIQEGETAKESFIPDFEEEGLLALL